MMFSGVSAETYRRQLIRKKLICAALTAVVLAINVFVLNSANRETATALLWTCVLTDTLAGWVILTYAGVCILPAERKYRLLRRAGINGIQLTGAAAAPGVYQFAAGIECRTLVLETKEGRRLILIPVDELDQLPESGATLCVTLVDNIAVAWEVLP